MIYYDDDAIAAAAGAVDRSRGDAVIYWETPGIIGTGSRYRRGVRAEKGSKYNASESFFLKEQGGA